VLLGRDVRETDLLPIKDLIIPNTLDSQRLHALFLVLQVLQIIVIIFIIFSHFDLLLFLLLLLLRLLLRLLLGLLQDEFLGLLLIQIPPSLLHLLPVDVCLRLEIELHLYIPL